jgi:hypothetical protein
MPKITKALYERIYAGFQAPVSRYDCGAKCAPHNGGTPVCCSTDNAVPLVDKWEFGLLRSRSDLWRPYEPTDAAGREIVKDLHKDCRAVECKGAAHCERDNRSMSCRAFPFFPYMTRDDEIVGLAYFWAFEDRCWIVSNLQVVDKKFVRECLASYELLFAHDADERKANREEGAYMRRTFSRWNRLIPLIGREGELLAVEPYTHKIRPARIEEFPRHGPYKSEPRVRA